MLENLLTTKLLARNSPWRNWLVWGFLGGLLVLGLAIWRDYGISYDANQSRIIGMTSLRYVAEKLDPGFVTSPDQQAQFEPFKTPLPEFMDRDYGVGYELPVTLAERLLVLNDSRPMFLFRHLCTFLVSWVGVLALYGLGKRRYNDWRLGLAVAALLVLSPRLFGEFFYNDKDAVFMALCTVSTYTTVRFVERPAWGWALLHALACAITIDVRLMAVMWPLATLLLVAWRAGQGEYRGTKAGRVLGPLVLYCLLLPGLVVLAWPYLWEAPWANFAQAFDNMKHFRWGGPMLYRGKIIYANDIPWNYSLKWIGITTPLVQLGLILLGLGVVMWQAVRQGWRLYAVGTRSWQDLLFWGLGVGPVIAVIVFQSVLYDGWRQLYFIYPSLLLVALRGLVAAVQWLRGQPRWQGRLAAGVLGLGLLSSAGQMVAMHPFESLYFSALAGRDVTSRYEQDYWGIGYLAGLNWVAQHDDRPHIRVCTDGAMAPPLDFNMRVLPLGTRERFELVDHPEQADYFLANYRWHPAPYGFPNEVHTVRAGGQRVMSIFRFSW